MSGIADTVVVIVGYNNCEDILQCLAALSRAATAPRFDVFICENGGRAAYERLVESLIDAELCRASVKVDSAPPFVAAQRMALRGRSTTLLIGCANDNLGYAGGVNAWLRPLMRQEGWKGVWILNPDAEPAPDALGALVARAETGGKSMVGSTILENGDGERVRFRGGLQWRRLSARSVAIGLGERLDAPIDLAAIEQAMESPSGASMYVTRRCIEQIGLMDDSYFLFFEDLDWGARAKKLGLGYAPTSVVAHKRGTTTGSAGRSAALSRLAVYLQHRNAIHFARRHHPWSVPARIALSALFALRFLLHRAPGASAATLAGLAAGLRGETGAPAWSRSRS
ncbi:GT2 family glycosyltransferase [Rhodoblastus acidophilus]|uniref:glycosyltransferase family 2 protein n=1 Tax=Rhodoblastus acidophilus TaxID=1074 RepID=UPI00222409C6|nr:glycosyltransferase family 2 protein [Rhodoblastus acidophilus]MCW2283323.1 GT2 family glycosyltransferase [Rhodoblastus acidophilus]MCW2332353.1 GT2 family glycosyltransferase [Rhodoblastus acidophilus]